MSALCCRRRLCLRHCLQSAPSSDPQEFLNEPIRCDELRATCSAAMPPGALRVQRPLLLLQSRIRNPFAGESERGETPACVYGSRLSRHSASKTRVDALKALSRDDKDALGCAIARRSADFAI